MEQTPEMNCDDHEIQKGHLRGPNCLPARHNTTYRITTRVLPEPVAKTMTTCTAGRGPRAASMSLRWPGTGLFLLDFIPLMHTSLRDLTPALTVNQLRGQ